MKDNRTYIKLFHQILDWGWYGDTNTFRVFMHILLRANYQDGEYLGHTIKAGECVFGYNAWSEELGLSVRQLRTAITHLKSTNEIRVRATNKFSVITVVKWEFWQIEEGIATSDRQAKRQTSDKRATTSKDSKNNISISLRSIDIYSDLPIELQKALMDFEQMRKSIKSPMSDKARMLLLNKLDSLAGDDVQLKIRLLEESILHNWKSVYPLKENNNGKERMGQILDRGIERDSRGVAGTADGSAVGNGDVGVRFPKAAYSLQEDARRQTDA